MYNLSGDFMLYIGSIENNLKDYLLNEFDKLKIEYTLIENKDIYDLSIEVVNKVLEDKDHHKGIIIDEYGQTAGVVSMEDILEEIVGNILDEYDVDEHFIQEIGDHTYLMRGLTELSDVEDVLDIRFKDDFDTLNGFLISKLEHIPSIHEKPSIHYQGYCFEIVGMADNIIDMVRVSKSESF